jgi:hypothetical protein
MMLQSRRLSQQTQMRELGALATVNLSFECHLWFRTKIDKCHYMTEPMSSGLSKKTDQNLPKLANCQPGELPAVSFGHPRTGFPAISDATKTGTPTISGEFA